MPALDVRSKIVAALFTVGGIATLVMAVLGYQSGRETLTERVFAQLSGIAQTTAAQVEGYFDARRGQTIALSEDLMIRRAVQDFARASAEITQASPALADALTRFYETDYLPRLAAPGAGEPVTAAYLPQDAAGRTLQAIYVADADTLADGGAAPAPAYARTHGAYHTALNAIAQQGGYGDVFLITPDGFVAYTALKEADFATNLLTGPYADTGLARAFRRARAARGRGFVAVEDYGFYAPSMGAPAAFFATPLFEGGQLVGVLALQLNADTIDRIVNQDGRWAQAGLGETGEVFLAGADGMLRTQPRPFKEDRTAFLAAIRANGADAQELALIERYDTPVLLQSAASPATEAAIRGETSIRVIPADYTGRPALSASAPLAIEGLDWIVVAEMPVAEAYAPVRRFTRRILATAALLSLGLTVLAMILAARLMAPFRTLVARMNQVASGDLSAPVAMARRDEFGELSQAAQSLTDSLRERSETARAEREQAEALLSRFLPEGAIRALRGQLDEDGKVPTGFHIAEEVPAYTVAHLRLRGAEELLAGRSPQDGVAMLDGLIEQLDEAAERLGVEKVRVHADRYVAAAGLSAPLLDHDRRAIAFVREAAGVIERYAKQSGTPLVLSAGVASGAGVMVVVGLDRMSFDLIGHAVTVAEEMAEDAKPHELRLGPAVAAAVGEEEHVPLRRPESAS